MTISSKYEWSKQRSIEMSNCLSYLPCVSSSLNLWFSIICVHFGLCSIPIWAYNTKKKLLSTNLIREALMCLYSIEHVYILLCCCGEPSPEYTHIQIWMECEFKFTHFISEDSYWKLNSIFWKLYQSFYVTLCEIFGQVHRTISI